MSTLNSRGGWDSGITGSPVPARIPNVISVNVSTIRECDKTTEETKSQPRVPNGHT
ncbi:hypothetical protein FRC10_006281, partial [Ceratobasidium sp. 414]